MNAPTPPGPVLRDIHLPAEPGWWPPAPGWWLLACLLVVLSIWAGYRLHRWRLRRRRNARWLDEFDHAVEGTVPIERVRAAAILLRRAAIEYAPQAAALPLTSWVLFLQSMRADRGDEAGLWELLREGQWRSEVDADLAVRFVEMTRALLCQMLATGSSP